MIVNLPVPRYVAKHLRTGQRILGGRVVRRDWGSRPSIAIVWGGRR